MTAYSFDSDARRLVNVPNQRNVKPSGKGRTVDWPENLGTVTRVTKASVFVQWHDCAVEDEMNFDELVSTGTFAECSGRGRRTSAAQAEAANDT